VEPYPPLVRAALLAPWVSYAFAYLIAVSSDGAGPRWAAAGLLFGGGLVQLLAVLLATFLLVRDTRYLSVGKVILILLAAVPPLLIGFVLWVLKFGHFHI
jgi:hypothetical protein